MHKVAPRKSRKPATPRAAVQIADTDKLLQSSRRLLDRARTAGYESEKLIEQSRKAVADSRERFKLKSAEPGKQELSVLAGETELEMAVRHLTDQHLRMKRQRALIARLLRRRLPTSDAKELLAAMLRMFRDMQEEVRRLTAKAKIETRSRSRTKTRRQRSKIS